jgi:hypothetical protein
MALTIDMIDRNVDGDADRPLGRRPTTGRPGAL